MLISHAMEEIMTGLITVSSVEEHEMLQSNIDDLFKRERYEDISRAIGIYSILIDPQHTISEQERLYRYVLDLIKKKINTQDPKNYSSWLASFPKLLSEIVASGKAVSDQRASDAVASRHAAFGPFRSLDDFYFWALDDRRLALTDIMKYIQATLILHYSRSVK